MYLPDKPEHLWEKVSFVFFSQLSAGYAERGAWDSTCQQIDFVSVRFAVELVYILAYHVPFRAVTL